MNNQFQPPTINRDSVNTIAINISWTVQTTHSPRITDLSVKPFWDWTTFFGHDGVLKNTLAIMGMWIYCCNIRNGLNLQQSPKSLNQSGFKQKVTKKVQKQQIMRISLQAPNSPNLPFSAFGLPPFLNSISIEIYHFRINFRNFFMHEIDEITNLNAIYCQNINFINRLLGLR